MHTIPKNQTPQSSCAKWDKSQLKAVAAAIDQGWSLTKDQMTRRMIPETSFLTIQVIQLHIFQDYPRLPKSSSILYNLLKFVGVFIP